MELRSLTGLRWLAALGVFVHHSRQLVVLPGVDAVGVVGAAGVVLFFVLSGFVLSWSDRGIGARSFYRNRAARIMPLHLVALALAIPVMYADPPFAGAPLSVGTIALVALLLQGWAPWSMPVFFGGNPVSWSLSFEAFFYALFPLQRRLTTSVRGLLLVAAAGVLVPWLLVLLALVLGTSSETGAAVARSPLSCVTVFVSGVCLGRAVRLGWRLRLWPGAAAGLVLLSWCLYLLVVVVVPDPLTVVWLTFPVSAPAFALLVASLASYELEGSTSWLGSHRMVRLGIWSYAFYLVHLTVIHAVALVADPPGSFALDLALVMGVLGVSILLAATLHRWVEAPAQARLRAPVAEVRTDVELDRL